MTSMPEFTQILVLVLAGLTYLLVTCVLTVMAAQRKHAIDVHDRVRESKRLRQEYLQALDKKSSR